MSKPAAPRAGHDGVPETVVEIDAIDVAEWERDQHTPQAPVAGLAALVRQTVPQPVRIEPRHRHAASQPLPVQSPPAAQARAAQPKAPQAQTPQAQTPQAQTPQPQTPQAQPQAHLAHPTLGPSEPTKLRGRPPRPPGKAAPSAPAAELATADATVPEPAPAHAAVQLPAAAPRHVAPEVVQLPLNAPPSEPITTPALMIPRPFVVEAEQRLRAQPDHTPAPPAPLGGPLSAAHGSAPPALDSFDPSARTGASSGAASGVSGAGSTGNTGNTGDESLDAIAGGPDASSIRPRFASRRVIALAAVTAAAVIAVIVVAATRGSTPRRSPAKGAAASSHVVAQVKPPPEPTPSVPAARPSPPQEPAPSTPAAQPSPPPPPSETEHAVAAPEPGTPRTVPRLRDEPLVSAKPHRLRPASSSRGMRKPAKAVAVRPAAHQEPAETAEDEPSIARARVAYDAGNQALFAGDSAAAIRAYRQVLGYVPTYAAGFRGLGLAHAQQGDIGAAIMALRTYLTLAPQARDVALIKKRIAILQAASAAERSAQRTDR